MGKPTVNIGLNVTRCDKCEKTNIAIANLSILMWTQEIFKKFRWEEGSILSYDEETETILIDEKQLMRIIQIANPVQEPRKLKLVNKDDLK